MTDKKVVDLQDPNAWDASGMSTELMRQLAKSAQSAISGVVDAAGRHQPTDIILNQVFQALSIAAHHIDHLESEFDHVPMASITRIDNTIK